MANKGMFSFSMVSVVEDVLQQHGTALSDIDLASRKAEEAALRRYEAAGWLRKMVGVVGAKDLAAEPSEEEFRLGLRSGIILCNVLNKIQPGSVAKVVESPGESIVIPDGAALSAYQYFENVRNFLVAMEEMRLPTFEASDLEQGGKSSRIVNCILALKSYGDRKQPGGPKFGSGMKPSNSGKFFTRKNSEPFMNSLAKTSSSMSDKSSTADSESCGDLVSDTDMNGHSLNVLVRTVLSDKRPEEVPFLVESMLSKVIEEFERRLASHNETMKTAINDAVTPEGGKTLSRNSSDVVPGGKTLSRKSSEVVPEGGKTLSRNSSGEMKMKVDVNGDKSLKKLEDCHEISIRDNESKRRQLLKQQVLFDRQNNDIQALKHTLHTTKEGIQFMQMKYHEEFNNLGRYMKSLASAASGYHRVLEENRKLYNQVQDLKGSIRVYCRVRPFMPGQSMRCCIDNIEEGTISITTPSKYGKEGRKSFNFNKVFGPSSSQEEVFADTRPLIRSVLDGYNVCIFAYGQTGSGKTHTMSGPKELTEKTQGVNFRALGDLFFLSEQRKDTFRYEISVQMIEIYNEQVRDLLVTDGLNKRLEIRNSSQNGVNVPDANLVPVYSTSDVIELMNVGQKNRSVGATALNDRSSRSHSCLTVHVQGRDLTTGNTLRGCMHLVDLAGSERVDKSEVTGDRLKEAQHINKSLSALGDVIASLAQKNGHVPYRNSKLTQLLQDSLGGQAKTLMFVHISPELDAVGETISTLKFAERVATVELGAAKLNKDSGDVKELKEQINSLKAALARKEGASEHHQYSSANSSPERHRMKAGGSSPSHPSRQISIDSTCGISNQRQPMEDVGNIEVWNDSPQLQKRPSFDLQELLMSSPPWPPVDSLGSKFQKEDEKDDWVDKVMVNKLDNKNNPLRCPDGENDIFYQRHLVDARVFPEQPYNKILAAAGLRETPVYDLPRNRFDVASENSDELDFATSDSSEPDLLWQLNLTSKVTPVSNGVGLKLKKSHSSLGSSPDLSSVNRSGIPRLAPSPSRKLVNGVGNLSKNGRRVVSSDGKRKGGNGK